MPIIQRQAGAGRASSLQTTRPSSRQETKELDMKQNVIARRIVRSAPNGAGPHADLLRRPTRRALVADRVQSIALIGLCYLLCRISYQI